MALLLLRIGIILTIGLYTLNGPVSAYLNVKGPDPRIRFILEPPPTGIVSKNLPLLLPCLANVTVDNLYQYSDGDYENNDDENDEDELDNNNRDDLIPNHKYHGRNRDTINHSSYYDDEETENNEEDDGDEMASHNVKRSIDPSHRKRNHQPFVHVQYTWFRNNMNLSETLLNGFRVFNNGTLKIFFTENSSGTYHCLANATENNFGAILSTKSVVSSAIFQRENLDTNITAIIGYPLVVQCPVKSVPPAHISWYFNKNLINFSFSNATEKRYYQLTNGSMLIAKIKGIDNGKYRCVAVNNLLPKSQRNYTATVTVVPFDIKNKLHGLLPALQNQTLKIEVGGVLRIFCVSYAEEIFWSFKSRFSNISKTITNKTFELLYINVNISDHDGFYTCRLGNITQTFDVRILTPPRFVQSVMSSNTSIAATITLNCSAVGNPLPKISWYRNGLPLKGNMRIKFGNGTMKLCTIDPEDEGVYQCFASNDDSEIYSSGYITIRKKHLISNGPQNVKCFPINHSTVLVSYDKNPMITGLLFYLSTNNPFKWFENPLVQNITNSNIKIDKNMQPLKPYSLFLRGVLLQGETSIGERKLEYFGLTKLSTEIKCATQGLFVQTRTVDNQTYLWWPKLEEIRPRFLIIQFWHSDSSNPILFSDFIIGTYEAHDENSNWQEIEQHLEKIPAITTVNFSNEEHTSSNITITGVKVFGNVTGILLPNTNKHIVRVLGSIYDNETELTQDLRYLEWNNFDATIAKPKGALQFQVVATESRSVTFTWNDIGETKICLKICYKVTEILKHDVTNGCVNINSASLKETITGLSPFTTYKFSLQTCDNKDFLAISPPIQTKIDVPGPVRWHNISTVDGVQLNWEPPSKLNGILLHYSIEWTKNGENMSIILDTSKHSFTFPNITNTDSVKITIRAVGTAGDGIPIYVNLPLQNREEDLVSHPQVRSVNPVLGIAIGACLSILCVFSTIFYVVRDRSCKKQNRNLDRSLPSAPITSIPQCNSDIHEMQTLINKTETSILIPNGHDRRMVLLNKNKTIDEQEEDDEDEDEDQTNHNGKNISHNDDMNGGNYVTEIPPAPDDDDIKITSTNGLEPLLNDSNTQLLTNGNSKKLLNGTIKNLPLTHSISTNLSVKTNGNLKITDNPQYLQNSTFTLDNSQQILLDSTLDKISHIDDEDSDTDLNESNLSTKPLQSTWNYRRPIVGPNG